MSWENQWFPVDFPFSQPIEINYENPPQKKTTMHDTMEDCVILWGVLPMSTTYHHFPCIHRSQKLYHASNLGCHQTSNMAALKVTRKMEFYS